MVQAGRETVSLRSAWVPIMRRGLRKENRRKEKKTQKLGVKRRRNEKGI